MRIVVDSFRGEVPLVTPRALPNNAAQSAVNARLQTGDLESWRQFLSTKELSGSGPVQTIYLLNDKWLSWDQQVDVARSVVPGDTSFRIYLTCPDLYGLPQWTDYSMATTGSEPYPVATLPIGVPAPDTAPTGEVGADPTPVVFTIDISDDGTHLATDWVTSTPLGGSTYSVADQHASYGNPLPSYRLRYDEIHNPGEEPWIHRDVGIGDATLSRMSVDFALNNNAPNFSMLLQADENGNGPAVNVTSSGIAICSASGWGIYSRTGIARASAPVGQGVFYSLEMSVATNPNVTKTVTATLRNGLTVLATVTATSTFDNGGFIGFSSASPDDVGSPMQVNVDNIVLHATGPTDYVPVNEAISYVYTFVNDIGQESAPSLASETISRPQGVTVTVTTPTDVPVGTDPDYNIVEKRIYRAVTGSSGTAFLRVGTIPLATADFVDTITDDNAGPVLESDEWDLPPANLQGIRALPNGLMCGFFENQLCFSVQGRPHAWRVRDRHTTDTNIVAICNIDTTVVVGTKSFAYTATGTSNDNYSMSQPGEAQACVSKLGMVFLDGLGVVFPSPDGWMLCSGSAGSLSNITGAVFTRRQWQELNPESIVAAVHDGVLHWFYDNGSTPEENDVLVVTLTSAESGNFGGDPINTWSAYALTESAYASIYEGEVNEIRITQAGVYEVTLNAQLSGNYGFPDTHFKNYSTIFGTRVSYGLPSQETRHNVNAGGSSALGGEVMGQVQFTDQFVLVVEEADLPFTFVPEVFALSYQNAFETYAAAVSMVVRRSGDYLIPA